MKKLLSAKLAGTILLVFMFLLIIFHLLIIFNVIPMDIFLGGQIKNTSTNILLMELIALVVTLVFILIITAKINKSAKYRKLVNIGVWIIFIYLILNTLANLASEQFIEKAVLAPMTLIMSFFAFRLAIEK
ncbi:MAG: hypothetical protein KAT38_05960 [Bacteroidales bacterium]|nr:hypothetical protein [Bacteroidales bacterium]